MRDLYRIVLASKIGNEPDYWTRNYGFSTAEEAMTFSGVHARFVLNYLKNPYPSICEDPKIEAVPERCVCPNRLAVVVVALLVAILLAVVLK